MITDVDDAGLDAGAAVALLLAPAITAARAASRFRPQHI
jgi:hypothetical protein